MHGIVGKDAKIDGVEENIKKVRRLKNHSFHPHRIPENAKLLIGSLGRLDTLAGPLLEVLEDTSDTNYHTWSLAVERMRGSLPRLEGSLSNFTRTQGTRLGLTWEWELTKDFYTAYRDFIFLCNCLEGVFASVMASQKQMYALVGSVKDEMGRLLEKAEKVQGMSAGHPPHDIMAISLDVQASFGALESLVGGVFFSLDDGSTDEYRVFCMDVDEFRRQVKRLAESAAFYSRSEATDMKRLWGHLMEEDRGRLIRSLEDAISSSKRLIRTFISASEGLGV